MVGGGVQTESTRHVGHFLWERRILRNEDWQGKPKYSEKTCSSATLSTTNPTWPDPGSNPARRNGKPTTNCFRYGAAIIFLLFNGYFSSENMGGKEGTLEVDSLD
jgi:hypothetical protein